MNFIMKKKNIFKFLVTYIYIYISSYLSAVYVATYFFGNGNFYLTLTKGIIDEGENVAGVTIFYLLFFFIGVYIYI